MSYSFCCLGQRIIQKVSSHCRAAWSCQWYKADRSMPAYEEVRSIKYGLNGSGNGAYIRLLLPASEAAQLFVYLQLSFT